MKIDVPAMIITADYSEKAAKCSFHGLEVMKKPVKPAEMHERYFHSCSRSAVERLRRIAFNADPAQGRDRLAGGQVREIDLRHFHDGPGAAEDVELA